jgi:hypothetical protein
LGSRNNGGTENEKDSLHDLSGLPLHEMPRRLFEVRYTLAAVSQDRLRRMSEMRSRVTQGQKSKGGSEMKHVVVFHRAGKQARIFPRDLYLAISRESLSRDDRLSTLDALIKEDADTALDWCHHHAKTAYIESRMGWDEEIFDDEYVAEMFAERIRKGLA